MTDEHLDAVDAAAARTIGLNDQELTDHLIHLCRVAQVGVADSSDLRELAGVALIMARRLDRRS